ncbi:MAG: hypothetical protein KAV41_00985 [Candidatus Pacebacteria bacterium]|nr:hypothetical protein [Candidatus Paceibacterota bacterium]
MKKSQIEQKRWYRVAKIILWIIPSLVVLAAFFLLVSDNFDFDIFKRDITYIAIGLILYYLIVSIAWSTFLYIMFGVWHLENDTKLAKYANQPVAPEEQQPIPPTPEQAPTDEFSKVRKHSIIALIIEIVVIAFVGYLVLYSYHCATGKYPNTEDRMCQSIYQTFSGKSSASGGGGSQVSIGCRHCSPGYCWVNSGCCPSYAKYHCNGHCYRSQSEAYNAGCHQSGWKWYCCQ